MEGLVGHCENFGFYSPCIEELLQGLSLEVTFK